MAASASVPLRVAIGEDNLLVREGLQGLLSTCPDLDVVAACGDLASLRAEIERCEPDVVVTDIRMPPGYGDEGVQLAVALRRTRPTVGVVLVSQHAEVEYALALLEGGSQGRAYLLKERLHRVDELTGAIRTVAGGGSVIDAEVVDMLVAEARHGDTPLEGLTRRELDVLDAMARGSTNAAIAAQLHLTEHSVEKYVSAIMVKLDLAAAGDVHRRVRAVLIYLAHRAPAGGRGSPSPPG